MVEVVKKKIPYEPHAKQLAFHQSQAKYRAIVTGVGFGKTACGAVEMLLDSITHPGTLNLILAPTFPMVSNVTIREFLKFCPPEVILNHNRSQHLITIQAMDGKTSEIIYLSGDNETDIDRVRGLTLGAAYLDEVAICPEYLWQVVAARIRDPNGSGRIWITTTPKGFNWVYDYFGNKSKGTPEDYAIFGGSTEDNPYTPEGYKDTLKAMYAGAFAKQELYGEFIGFEGLVYSEFRRNVHIVKPEQMPSKFKEIVCGVDWGWTNPTAVIWAGVDADMRVWLLDEVYQKQLQIDSIIDLIQQKNANMEVKYGMRPNRYLCDPSTPENIDKLKIVGLNAKPSDNEVLAGISTVGARLALQGDNKTRLYVADKCINTIYEFETYRYKDKKEGRPEKEEPLKIFDHGMDAIRYICSDLKYAKNFVFDFASTTGGIY